MTSKLTCFLLEHINLETVVPVRTSEVLLKSNKMGQPDSVVYGKWQLFQSENFEEFVSRLGVSYLVRKLGNKSTPVVTVSKDDNDVMSFKQESLVSTTEIKCKIGEPFDEKTADGREVVFFFFFGTPISRLTQDEFGVGLGHC